MSTLPEDPNNDVVLSVSRVVCNAIPNGPGCVMDRARPRRDSCNKDNCRVFEGVQKLLKELTL
jgi:hypothetical protein